MAVFIRLVDCPSAEMKEKGIMNPGYWYSKKQESLLMIPGCPIAYWMKHPEIFLGEKISNCACSGGRLKTHNNQMYLRYHWEIGAAKLSDHTYFIIENGGNYRKWYGNREWVVDFSSSAKKEFSSHGGLPDCKFWDQDGISWGMITTFKNGFRYKPSDSLYSSGSPTIFPYSHSLLGFLNSKVADYLISIINPTFNTSVGEVLKLPYTNASKLIEAETSAAITIAKAEWDSHETSSEFQNSLFFYDYTKPRIDEKGENGQIVMRWPKTPLGLKLSSQVEQLKREWTLLFMDLVKHEVAINKYYIDMYCLQGVLSPDVPYSEITILQEELSEESRRENQVEFCDLFLVRQLISYGVGCIMGRYSVDKNGLILGNAGSSFDDYMSRVPETLFTPDQDGILPLTDEDDFPDDLPTTFKSWLRFISGAHYGENLHWIEDSLGKALRTYFDRDFYKDHVKRYKSRPIYWMVSSPSGAFRALIYLHRYNKDTIGKVLNDYVRPYRTKLDQKIRGLESVIDSGSSSAGEKTKAKKRLAQLEKYKVEIEAWEKEKLYPLALNRVELDLDDGVKVNYRKLEGILEPVKQLEAKEED